MANSNAARDPNRVPLAMGVSGSDTVPLRVDAATGRVILDVTATTTTVPATLPATIPRDENHVPVSAGVHTTSVVSPLIVDNRSGLLFIDLVIE
jgi:hypothetical protein